MTKPLSSSLSRTQRTGARRAPRVTAAQRLARRELAASLPAWIAAAAMVGAVLFAIGQGAGL